jgi:hypothetical protein
MYEKGRKTNHSAAIRPGMRDLVFPDATACLQIAFDNVISVAAAQSFKPHVATYTKAAEIMGV